MHDRKIHFTSTPPIYGYPVFANVLSVISQHEQANDWYYSNFIQLGASTLDYTVNFYQPVSTYYIKECPFIKHNSISRWIVTSKWDDNIVDFLIQAIDEENYIYFFVDESSLTGSTKSRIYDNFAHDIMVYGYDKLKRVFYIAGAFLDGKYIETTCSFEEMQQAHDKMDYTKDRISGIFLLQFCPYRTYKLKIPYVLDKLSEYIYSKNSAYKLDQLEENRLFGLDVYSVVIEYLNQLAQDSQLSVKTKTFHFLWEHKKCMMGRIDYFERTGILIDSPHLQAVKETYKKITNMSELHRNLMIKHQIKNSDKDLIKIAKELSEISKKEKEMLQVFIELLA